MTRLNGHDHLKRDVSTALPGSRDRVLDLAEWYQLEALLPGERISPFEDPKEIDDDSILMAKRSWRGNMKDSLGGWIRQQRSETE